MSVPEGLLHADLNGSGGAQAEARQIERPSVRENKTAAVLLMAINALTEKAYLWVTLLVAASFWGYVIVVAPTRERIVAAVLCTVLTHLPAWRLAWRTTSKA